MARYRISYTAYPSSKEATEYSRCRAICGFYVGWLVNMMIIGAVLWYVYGVMVLFGEFDVVYYLMALAAIVAMSWLTLYFYVLRSEITDRECKLIILRENGMRAGAESAEVKTITDQIKEQYRESLSECTKAFFRVFIPGLISGTGLLGAIKSVYMLCHNEGGLCGLIIALVVMGGCITYYIWKYVPKNNRSVSEPAESNACIIEPRVSLDVSDEMMFCRKCGMKILSDSVFCSKCGTKIIR